MLHPLIIFTACLPLLYRLVVAVLPAAYLEPYAYWSSEGLNRIPGQEVSTRWRNMGYWADTNEYGKANEALATRLLDFANATEGGAILDIAHGAGDSLLLHLSHDPPPKHLHALTSLSSDTLHAQDLISSKYPNPSTDIQWFTSSASFRPGKDHDHPLNPMRGFLGRSKSTRRDQDADEDGEVEQSLDQDTTPPGPPPYDLIYILDAIYHFPPSLPHFLATVLPALTPETGVVAYTDILPPPDLSPIWTSILPSLLSIPGRNVAARPKGFVEYKALLERIGYVEVEIEDWSEGVWNGLAGFLRERGGVWGWVAWGVEQAEKTGWKFVAVRAKRPALKGET
ncbi:hypothetical protein P7C73_g4720, partial [Tremellales sp. Uapishka_1]